jgi:hypothetical protein
MWTERYEPGAQSDPSLQADGAAFAALVSVCGHLPKFIDDGEWKPSTPLETLVTDAVIRGALHTNPSWSSSAGRGWRRPPCSHRRCSRTWAAANWLVLHRDAPDWLLQQFEDHRDAVRLAAATRLGDAASAAGVDVSDLAGREGELRSRFGSTAEQPWWARDRCGRPMMMSDLIQRLAAAEQFHPRLRGETPVLEEQYAAQRAWLQALQHAPGDAERGEDPASARTVPGAPNPVVVLFGAYWVFGQLI